MELQTRNCLKFKHYMVFFTILCSWSLSGNAYILDGESDCCRQSLDVEVGRAPASYVPNDEVEVVPEKQEIWLKKVFIEDSGGIVKSMRETYQSWEKEEEYARNWNLTSSGLYTVRGQKERKAYFDRMILKYIDKRISGEVKTAEKGSTFHRVGQVQKALKPKAEVSISSKVKLKVKARLLEQKAILELHNPYVEYKTDVEATGEITMKIRKDIKFMDLKASVDYQVDKGSYLAYVDKKITPKITGRVSSSQSDKEMAFGSSSNKQVQFFYNHSF